MTRSPRLPRTSALPRAARSAPPRRTARDRFTISQGAPGPAAGRRRHLTAALVAGALATLAAPAARADVSAAARAFADGQAAQMEGNHERAAQSYELAFHIAPSKEALRSAVRARQLANQLPRAATLAQVLLTQYADDADSTRLANDVINEARGKLARLAITCAPQCTVAIGGRAISLDAAPSHTVFVTPGQQNLEITFDGDRSVTRDITLKLGDDVTLGITPPPAPPHRRARPAAVVAAASVPVHDDVRPLPPAFVIGGGALTAVLAGVTIWSGLDTDHAHDDYVKAPTPDGWSSGRSKQLRTNLLLGATAAVGVATGLVAVFWTQWGEPPAHLAIAPASGGATVSFGGRF